MIKKVVWVGLISFLIFSKFGISSVLANTISGTVSLPTGITAPSGGVTLTIQSRSFDDIGFGRDTVTIPSGASSTNYSLIFSDDTDRRIVFDCLDSCGSLDITTSGGWSNADGVVAGFFAQVFVGSQDHVVNIELEPADTFTGTASLPAGLTARGNEFIFVSVSSNDLFSFVSFSDGEILTAGQTSFDFRIGVPSKATSSSWEVRFVCLTCEDRIESEDHYATTNLGGTPTLNSDLSFPFLKNADYGNLSLTLIDNQPISVETKPIISPIMFLLFDDDD